MTFSPLTNRLHENTVYRGSRNGVKPTLFVVHHTAGTNDAANEEVVAGMARQSSAHYVILNTGEIVGVVNEDYRAWSLSSTSYDSKAITVEVVNSTAGPTWNISDRAYRSLARLIEDCSRRYGFALNRSQVLGHREVYTRFSASYATACPGGINLDYLVNLSNEIRGGAPIPLPTPVQTVTYSSTASTSSWAFNAPSAARQADIQANLKKRGRYTGPVDGAWGSNSIKGIQQTISNVGYDGPIDGIVGKNTCYYVQVYAQKFGSYTGPIDSILGTNSWNGFALGLERP